MRRADHGALPRPPIPSGEPELPPQMASQAAASGLTNVVPCVTARCAYNRHPARERRQDDARLSCCCRSGCWSGRRVGRFGAVRCLTSRARCAVSAGACGQRPCGTVSLGAEPFTRPGPAVERPRSSAPCPATSGTALPVASWRQIEKLLLSGRASAVMGMKAPGSVISVVSTSSRDTARLGRRMRRCGPLQLWALGVHYSGACVAG